MKIFHHNAHEHIKDEEANQQDKSYEVEQSPFRIILDWLKRITRDTLQAYLIGLQSV